MSRLRSQTAAGPDGICAPMLKRVCYMLPRSTTPSPVLKALTGSFQLLLDHAVTPKQWAHSLLVPVHKRNGMLSWANYRPITVTDVLYRAFMSVLNARLSSWAEDQGVLADEQFGFRKRRGTIEATFVLQHFTDAAKARRLGPGTMLYAAFLDLNKAYDSVHRSRL